VLARRQRGEAGERWRVSDLLGLEEDIVIARPVDEHIVSLERVAGDAGAQVTGHVEHGHAGGVGVRQRPGPLVSDSLRDPRPRLAWVPQLLLDDAGVRALDLLTADQAAGGVAARLGVVVELLAGVTVAGRAPDQVGHDGAGGLVHGGIASAGQQRQLREVAAGYGPHRPSARGVVDTRGLAQQHVEALPEAPDVEVVRAWSRGVEVVEVEPHAGVAGAIGADVLGVGVTDQEDGPRRTSRGRGRGRQLTEIAHELRERAAEELVGRTRHLGVLAGHQVGVAGDQVLVVERERVLEPRRAVVVARRRTRGPQGQQRGHEGRRV
jgi:hypothetical protein